jgi:Protein of unknown function (DUF1351)
MTMLELTFNPKQIIVTQGLVKFTEYEKIKDQATALAEQIKTVEVNEDNIKESKKLLAAVNKRCKELEDERIRIKKLMLEPYQEFEGQVKEIVSIVKEADNEVRQQVKRLEEMDRMTKYNDLDEIFQKRLQHYKTLEDLILFDHFVEPRHLNKTTSLDSAENEMIVFLEKTRMDFEAIASMNYSSDILNAYMDSFNLAAAMQKVNQEWERKKAIENSNAIKKQPAENFIAYLVTVKVYTQKELKLLEMILQENEFEFITDKVEL